MPNPKKSQAAVKSGISPVTLLLTGMVCMAVGLALGYYFGHQTAPEARPAPLPAEAPLAAPSAGVTDPAAFMQEESRLKGAVAANPKDLASLIRLGNMYYDGGRYRDAVEWYGRALDVDPRNADVRTDRGTCYWNLDDADSAIAEFQKSLAVNPTHPQTLYNLGVVQLHGKNSVAEARKAWEKLLATNPNYPERGKIQEQLAALSSAPANAPMAPSSGPNVRDLLERMKKNK